MYPIISPSDYEAHFYAYPHLHGLPGFQICGNLYFVGDDNVGIHLLDTGDGLILIDTGYPEMQAWLIQNLWQLGFDPAQLRYIIHTHAHFDHLGATNLLTQLSPAKTCMSAVDAAMMQEQPDLVFADCHALRYDAFFVPDILLQDGDEITLGKTRLWVRSAPGHTMGTLAIFCTVQDGQQEYIAGLHGGLGLNTLSRSYMEKHHITGAREAYLAGLRRLMDEPVDILLGNHTKHNDLLTKRAALLSDPTGPNPFLDRHAWKCLLQQAEADLLQFCQADP